MKFLVMFPLCYGLGLLLSFAQSPRIFVEYPANFYEEKDYEISWKIQGSKIKKIHLEKLVKGKKPEIIEKKLPISGKKSLPFAQDVTYHIVVETKKEVYTKNIIPKFQKIELTELKVSKSSIEEGEATEISWKTTPNSRVYIYDGNKLIGANLMPEATLKVRPDTTKYYKIVVSAPATSFQVLDSVKIEVKKSQYFNVPVAVLEQDSIEIRWAMPYSQKLSLIELAKPLTE